MRLRFEQFAPADPPNSFDPWHRISLIDDNDEVTMLFEEAMDGDEFIAWFFENEEPITSEVAPFPLNENDSLRQSFEHAWDRLPDWHVHIEPSGVKDPDDPEADRLGEYRQRHSSAFAARGMEFPEIFFGIGYHGPEVSCIGAPGSWHPEFWSGPERKWQYYPVDYPEFFRWLRTQHPDKAPPPTPLPIFDPVGAWYTTPDDGRDPDSYSLEEIDGTRWGAAPDGATPLMLRVYQVRTQPISSYTAEDLRVLISQQVSLNVAIPCALVHLQPEPLLQGDFYPGDVLVTVLKVSPEYWTANPSHRATLEKIVSRVDSPEFAADIEAFRNT